MSLLTCEWRKLAFANYIVTPDILRKYIPPHTEIDFFNGNCYVSLVGFQFKNVKIAGVKVPFHTNFEEVNLRFYVRRFDGKDWRHGTVFLSEIADKRLLAAMANSLFHENYRTMPMKHIEKEENGHFRFGYHWQFKEEWQHLEVTTGKVTHAPDPKGETAFLIHKLWGYGKHSDNETNEYEISHPLWQAYDIKDYDLKIDFSLLFGSEFSHLTKQAPHSIVLAEGSGVEIQNRKKLGKREG